MHMQKNIKNFFLLHKKRLLGIFCLLLLSLALSLFGIADNRQKALEQDPSLYKTMDAEGTFHIYDAKDFMAFLQYVHTGHKELNAALEADIEIEKSPYWLPYYAGNFDGQAHKITGLTRELFLVLEKDGIVENLTIEVSMTPYEGTDTGGLIYYNYGIIRNCEVYGTVTGYNYVGGIAGINTGLIQNCKNYASVTSLEDGQTMEYSHWSDGYGAGGIAGLCATDQDEESPEICAIIDCDNYGDVTGKSYAGGIVAYLDDRMEDTAPASSVQELVQNEDFITPSDSYPSGQESEAQDAESANAESYDSPSSQKESAGKSLEHYSLERCRNYGTVTTENRQDPRTLWYTQAAGICAELHWGNIYECANLGKVCFAESAPKYSEDGYIYTNCPMAITYNMGFAPTKEHHIINCVNLKGTIAETMRHENIMELSKEDMAAWENGTYQDDYVSNNWAFDLPKAVDICGLQPLNIGPNPLLSQASSPQKSKRKKNYYLCDAFAIYLPEYIEIEEAYLTPNDPSGPYALHITVNKDTYQEARSDKSGSASQVNVSQTPPRLSNQFVDGKTLYKEEYFEINCKEYEECWIVRKDADVLAALNKTKESNTRDEWRVRYFLDELFGTVYPYHYMDICSLNLPFHNSFQTRYLSGRRIFAEGSIPDMSLYNYLQEGDHVLGNMLVMPLYGLKEPLREQMKAQWIMVFTMEGSNIHPSREFIDLVEAGFYPLSGAESIHKVEAGDNLWQLAKDYTLRPENWKMLADLNGINNPAHIVPGQYLLVPSLEEWEGDEIILTPSCIQ